MTNLFENYTNWEILLEDSLIESGYQNQTIVLNDNGYLPPHIKSPISFFTGIDSCKKKIKSLPKFFNDISIPAYWEIKGNGQRAEIYDGYKKKGIINYTKKFGDKRLVECIEWLNDEERVRAIDLYNQMGKMFGRKTYSDGEHVLTSYFDKNCNEVITINHITETIQVEYKKKKHIFDTFELFVLFYFETAQIDITTINYNSLGRPFFISNAVKRYNPQNSTYKHTLFWQEESQIIPGNMKAILNNGDYPTKNIVVQNESEYSRLIKQIDKPTTVKLGYLGFIYKTKIKKTFTPSVLILTNSDQIEHINDLVKLLPDYKFMIAARTEMSLKLKELEKFTNVKLYPQVTEQEIEDLVLQTSIYLDINHGSEVNDILWTAFKSGLLLLGFNNTIHNKRFISKMNCFDSKEFIHLSDKLNYVRTNFDAFFESLETQRKEAGQASIKDYREVLE